MYNYLQFKNWKFGYKLVMGFGVIITGVLVYAGYNLSALYRINANSQTIDYYMDLLQGLNNRHIDHLEWVNTLGGDFDYRSFRYQGFGARSAAVPVWANVLQHGAW